MNTRTKYTNISQKTKKEVYERDGHKCVLCNKYVPLSMANAHIVPRSKGGLGCEENIVTLCFDCHTALDHTTNRKVLMQKIVNYIKRFYPDWTEESVTYKKGITNGRD